jgi:hypothetical protein
MPMGNMVMITGDPSSSLSTAKPPVTFVLCAAATAPADACYSCVL